MSKSTKSIRVKLYNLSNYKKMLLNKIIKNYNIVFNILLEDAYENIEYIKENFINEKTNKYNYKSIQKYFSGKTYHKQYGLEKLYDPLKQDLGQQVASYLELLKKDKNTQFPYIKTNNKKIRKEINQLFNKIINNINITNEEQFELENQIKSLESQINKNNQLRPVLFGRYEIKKNRGCCLLYCPKTNRYYAKLNILSDEEAKRMFDNYKNKNIKLNKYNQLYYLPSMKPFATDKTKPEPFIIVPLAFGKWQEQYLKMIRKRIAKPGAMKLIKIDDEYYLDIPIKISQEKKFSKPKTKLGVDLGIENIATIAILDKDNNIILTKKYNGNEYNEKLKEYTYKLTKAQKNNSKYPKDKKFLQGYIHKVANDIIDLAIKYKSQIYIEDLQHMDKSKNKIFNNSKFENMPTYIKKKIVANVNKWAYGQMKQILEYKCEYYNIPKPKKVNPKFTSEECSKCGHNEVIKSKGKNRNRETQNKFLCKKCGFEINADINAAINIAKYYDKAVVLKPKQVNDEIIIKHKNFNLEGRGYNDYEALTDFINKLKEYKEEYEQIPFEKRKKNKKLSKQYAVLKKLENEDYMKYFILEETA